MKWLKMLTGVGESCYNICMIRWLWLVFAWLIRVFTGLDGWRGQSIMRSW